MENNDTVNALRQMQRRSKPNVTPASQVSKRLQDLAFSHESSLAGLTSIPITNITDSRKNDDDSNIDTIAKYASLRSNCAQPPLDNAYIGGGSSVPAQDSMVVDLNLNPMERVAPHRLVLPPSYAQSSSSSSSSADSSSIHSRDVGSESSSNSGSGNSNNESDNDKEASVVDQEGVINMGKTLTAMAKGTTLATDPTPAPVESVTRGIEEQDIESLVSSTTLKAITALSALCDEATELELVARLKFLPQLSLFGQDLTFYHPGGAVGNGENLDGAAAGAGAGSSGADGDNEEKAKKDEMIRNGVMKEGEQRLDEVAAQKRDSELLRRISTFMVRIQTIFNFTLRCQRLVKNMVCQVGGCAVPFASYAGSYTRKDNTASMPGQGNGGNADNSNSSQIALATGGGGVFGTDKKILPLGEAIAKVLGILISIDAVIVNNFELLEAWDLYKNVIRDKLLHLHEVIQDNLQTNNIKVDNETSIDDDLEERQNLELLERMVIQLDFTLFSSRSFLMAIEQNFDPGSHFFTTPSSAASSTKNSNADKGNGNNLNNVKDASVSLHGEIKALLTTLYAQYCSRINTENETTERTAIMGVYGMYCLYRRLLPSHLVPDAKLHKSLCTLLPSLCPILTIYGDLPFMPAEFLSKYAPLERVRGFIGSYEYDPGDFRAEAKESLIKKDKAFGASAARLHSEALLWLVTADSELAPSSTGGVGDLTEQQQQQRATSIVESKTICILKGLMIARCSKLMLESFLVMHKSLGIPIVETQSLSSSSGDHIVAIERLCEVIKSIEKMLRVRRWSAVVSIQRAALKMVASSIYRRFDALRSAVDQHSATLDIARAMFANGKMARIGTSLSVIESLLKGSSTFSPARRYAIEIAICACTEEDGMEGFSLEDLTATENLLRHLGLLSDIGDNIKEACDCSFLYFHKEMLPTLIQHIYKSPKFEEIGRLQLVLSAFSDAEKGLLRSSSYFESQTNHHPSTPLYVKQYRSFIANEALGEKLMEPICQGIESDLRLSVYTRNIEEMKPLNPKQNKSQSYIRFLEMPPLRFCGTSLNLKRSIQCHLEKSFYNFSTVGIQDSQIYMEMSVLAKEVYGLDIIDNQLPVGTSEQGIDLLQVIKDIESFSTRYNYNMNQQNFVERSSDTGSKYLNTISIQNASASLKKHGIGIAKTAINRAYQLLSKKFQELSQLLINDYVQSLLSKERRWFDQERNQQDQGYHYDRAEAMAKEIGKLRVINQELNVLDRCRILLTEIGNVLGFVRIVKSGETQTSNQVMQYTFRESSSYLSSADICVSKPFVNMVTPDLSSEEIERAAQSLDNNISFTISSEYLEESDYLQAVVKVFRNVISQSDHSHLDNFFLVFPPLSLSWLDASLLGKEMMKKKFRTHDAFYTDDGFSIGSSFLLGILEQNDKLDALNWFESLRVNILHERSIILEEQAREEAKISALSSTGQTPAFFPFPSLRLKDSKDNEEEDNDNELAKLKVRAKRLESRKYEVDMLFYSSHGARIFFRSR